MITEQQQLSAALNEIADKAYAGMSDSDIKAECKHINLQFNIDNAYKRSEAIYKRVYES